MSAPYDTPEVLRLFSESTHLATGNGTHWFHYAPNTTGIPTGASRVLVLRFPNFDRVRFHVLFSDGHVDEWLSGDDVPFAGRALPYRMPNALLTRNGVSATAVLLEPQSYIPPGDVPIGNFLPLEETTVDELQARAQREYLWYGLLFGGLLILTAYNLAIFAYLREPAYLWYCACLSAFALLIAGMSGLGQQFLWPEHAQVTTRLALLCIALINAAMLKFSDAFMDLRANSPSRHRWFQWLAVIVLLPTLLLLRDSYDLAQSVMYLFATASMALILWTVLGMAWRGNRQSRFILLSYLCLFPGILLAILRYVGVLPSSGLVEHAIEAGIVAEALVLSLGLADRINILKSRTAAAIAERQAVEQTFSSRLLEMLEHEKQELGAFLHDSVGHDLAVLRHRLVGAGGNGGELTLLENAMDKLSASALSSGSLLLREAGLVRAVETTAKRALDGSGIELSYYGEEPDLPEQDKLHVYRILQECLSNTLKHADASEVIVRVDSNASATRIVYRDDGRGIDTTTESEGRSGFGLYSMRERARLCGARIELDGGPNQGFTLRLEIHADIAS